MYYTIIVSAEHILHRLTALYLNVPATSVISQNNVIASIIKVGWLKLEFLDAILLSLLRFEFKIPFQSSVFLQFTYAWYANNNDTSGCVWSQWASL